jgi:hypothetical protein
VVYVGSADGNLYALNARTGARLWNYTTGSYIASSPTVANGVVYVGSVDGKVYSFSLRPSDKAEQGTASARPDLRALRPDFNLKESKPDATPSSAER